MARKKTQPATKLQRFFKRCKNCAHIVLSCANKVLDQIPVIRTLKRHSLASHGQALRKALFFSVLSFFLPALLSKDPLSIPDPNSLFAYSCSYLPSVLYIFYTRIKNTQSGSKLRVLNTYDDLLLLAVVLYVVTAYWYGGYNASPNSLEQIDSWKWKSLITLISSLILWYVTLLHELMIENDFTSESREQEDQFLAQLSSRRRRA